MMKHRVIYSAEEIGQRVKELGQQISEEYQNSEVTAVGVLEDAFIFCADLIRTIQCPLNCGFTYVKMHSLGGHIDIHYTSELDITGRNVLLIGDVMDTGITFDYLTKQLSTRNPKSIKICVLLDKPDDRRIDIKPDFYAFQTTEVGVFGYGLGIQGKYRHFPFLAVAD